MAHLEMSQCTGTSGNSWFWHNYQACMKWQERHKTAFWKSRALALEYERNALLDYIHSFRSTNHDVQDSLITNLYPTEERAMNKLQSTRKRYGSCGGKSRKRSHPRKRHFTRRPNHEASHTANEDLISIAPETEFHDDPNLDDELLEFFKQSMRHKMELKQRRKASEESDSTDSSNFNHKSASVIRSEEMQILYGKNSAMIQGMETAMQLTFERNCDILNPALWPILPLKM